MAQSATFFESMFSSGGPRFKPETLLNFTALDARVRTHLVKTYATLMLATLVMAVGAAADIYLHVGGFLTTMVAFGCITALGFTAPSPYNLKKRTNLLLAYAFAQGASLGPLLSYAVALSPALPLTALLCTASVFVCFTLSALLTQRRALLYLGGFLSSALSAMVALRLGAWLLGRGGSLVFATELYGGLLVFCGYVLFDTQLIVEKAALGGTDHIGSALTLLVDLVAIFVRVLVILMRRAEEGRQREEERKRRRRD